VFTPNELQNKKPADFVAGGPLIFISALYLTLTGLRRHVSPRDDGDGDVRWKAWFGYASEPAADVSIRKSADQQFAPTYSV
jgi:hypothetical protein